MIHRFSDHLLGAADRHGWQAPARVSSLLVDRCCQQVAELLPQSAVGHAASSPVIVARSHEQLYDGALERFACWCNERSHRATGNLSEARRVNEDLNDFCVALERRFGRNPWSENDDIPGQNALRECSVSLGVTHLLPGAQTQADADRIGCRDPKAAVDVPPSCDHRSRAVGPIQRFDPHWRTQGSDRLLDNLHLNISRSLSIAKRIPSSLEALAIQVDS